jgi:putative nucleotidyltransferase with HDIG domain
MGQLRAHLSRPSFAQTQHARALRPQKMAPRELAAQTIVAGLFVVAAGALVAFSGPQRDLDPVALVLLVSVAVVAGRLDFEIGGGLASPAQLALVPMLFVLPPPVVPFAMVVALTLDRIPAVIAGRWNPQRLLTVVGDAWFAVGPAVVFTLAGITQPSFDDWPVYVLALAAQFAGDLGSSLARMGAGRGVSARQQLGVMAQVWFFDLLLSPIGFLAADASQRHDGAYLLILPLPVLLAVFARERRERIDHAIELSSAYQGTALLLGDVLSDDDEYTGSHSQGVVAFAIQVADSLNLGEHERRLVEFGAMLHDIGKIRTPKEILHKTGPLTDAEWTIMREHTIEGQRMLDRVGGTLQEVGWIVRSSHEHYDGSGYPDGLAGEAIPRAARIVAVADAHSAMTTDRTYRRAMSHDDAIAQLQAGAGTQFDPVVVAATVALLNRATPVAA